MSIETIPCHARREPEPLHVRSLKPERRSEYRNRTFDLLRILFAVMVIYAHAFEMTDGNRSREVMARLTHSDLTLGGVAVDGFFLLSGYLIVRSWSTGPRLISFLQKRLLRILPAYLTAAFLSLVVVGFLAPAVPHWFVEYWAHGAHNLKSILHLSGPLSPRVFPGHPNSTVNGPMWTIAYEFRCYLLVAIAGLLGAVRRPRVWACLTGALLILAVVPPLQHLLSWSTYWVYWGTPVATFRLMPIFFIGGAYFLFRERIPFRPGFAVAAFVLLVLCGFYQPIFEQAIAVFGGYLLFYLGEKRIVFPATLARFPDISYGLYLYGAPVEGLWIQFVPCSPWITFAISTLFAGSLGWLSWHYVEKPMLRLKPPPLRMPAGIGSLRGPEAYPEFAGGNEVAL